MYNEFFNVELCKMLDGEFTVVFFIFCITTPALLITV